MTEPQPGAERPVIFKFYAENDDGDLIGLGIYDDFTGWMTWHDGHYRMNTDFPLNKVQVMMLLKGLAVLRLKGILDE